MSDVERRAEVSWHGAITSGRGSVTTDSRLLDDAPLSLEGRFQLREDGSAGETTPEELVAAALGSCYSMSLSHFLTDAGFTPEQLDVTATCRLQTDPGHISVRNVGLAATCRLSGMEQDRFRELAEHALDNCPVAHLFAGNADCELVARVEEPLLA